MSKCANDCGTTLGPVDAMVSRYCRSCADTGHAAVTLGIPDAPGMTPNTLPADADTRTDYPTRCPDCRRPVHTLAVFPRGRCLDCHAVSPEGRPVTDARQLARMWGAQT